MKIPLAFLVVISLVSLASSKATANGNRISGSTRRYDPNENDPHRIKYLIYQDKEGRLQFEDLTIESLETRAIAPQEIILHLYTKQHPTTSIAFSVQDYQLLHLYPSFIPTKPSFFIIHGWKNDYTSDLNVMTTAAILEKHDVNVFVVDWGNYADKIYTTSKSVVPTIGQYLGEFINQLMEQYQLAPTMFRLIGHSLGAHIAGCTGAVVNGKVDYIIGLDPASPLFSLDNFENRLDESDANFVQVIHTNGRFLGFSSAIGHSDYFPNDGHTQPGCGIDLFGMCAHSRSYHYYAESIRRGGFLATQCSSYEDFKSLECKNGKKSYFGTIDIDKSAAGDYYLDTNHEEPFALEVV